MRRCAATTEAGTPCRAAPLRAGAHCFWHAAETRDEAREARRLGGLRRRREGAIQGAYDFDGLGSLDDLRRLLEIAAADALGLENSLARTRALVAIVAQGAKLLEAEELAGRVAALEAALGPARPD